MAVMAEPGAGDAVDGAAERLDDDAHVVGVGVQQQVSVDA